jgi:uncharacterized surface protein with fasciclin (FAS1) repeats
LFAAPLFASEGTAGSGYRFVGNNDGQGLSVVDVLRMTGDHSVFLDLFERYDPEGLAILADPELADKTVWAPTDDAFAAVRDEFATMVNEEIKAILGYHISPPRRAPGGAYPIVTPEFLIDAGRMVHRTRTGVLTGSDQRPESTVVDGIIMIEGAQVLGTAWRTQTGSVFSLDAVIMDVEPASLPVRIIRRLIRILFYEDIRFFIYSLTASLLVSFVIFGVVSRMRKRASASE